MFRGWGAFFHIIGLNGAISMEILIDKSWEGISARLNAIRKAQGLNQTEFAAYLELANNTYNQYEKIKKQPPRYQQG